MLRSSARSATRRPSTRRTAGRGQTEPLAALAAVFAVGLALSLYAGALPAPGTGSDGVAETTLTRVYGDVSHAGVVTTERFEQAALDGPPGYAVNVSLTTATLERHRGPSPPPDSPNATRPVSVRIEDMGAAPGRLTVEVWT